MSAHPHRLVAVAAFALPLLALAHVTHAGAPPGRYTVPSPGAVFDTRTKLTWQENVPTTPLYVWGSASDPGTAQNYCATLSTGGAAPWRLPTVSELQTLIDYSQTGTASDGGPVAMIDSTFFPSTPGGVFWSSTPFANSPDFAWGVNFAFGNSNGYNQPDASYVRCVR